MSGDMMTEDAEEYSPLWWKLRWYNDDKFENELIEAIRAKDKPSTGAVYRIFLFICGILFFFAGWISWNIGLPAEGESGALGMNLKTILFFMGIFVFTIIAPYFAFVSISNSGRLSPSMPKAQFEYFRLKGAISDWEVHDHYWAALRDPDHEHHEEIIRYKWMDKVLDGSTILPISLGIRSLQNRLARKSKGPLVPKSSDEYRNSNFTLDGNGEPVFEGPTHPLKRILTLPTVLFIFGLVSFPISLVNAIISNTDNIWEILFDISIGFFDDDSSGTT